MYCDKLFICATFYYHKIQIQNSVPYRLSLVRLLALEELMRRIQITEPTFIRKY